MATSDRGGPAAPDPRDFTDPSPDPGLDTDLAVLCDALQEAGVTRALVHYRGSGDGGAAEEVEYEPGGASVPGWAEAKLRDVAEGYCPDGYENDAGGYGSLTVFP